MKRSSVSKLTTTAAVVLGAGLGPADGLDYGVRNAGWKQRREREKEKEGSSAGTTPSSFEGIEELNDSYSYDHTALLYYSTPINK